MTTKEIIEKVMKDNPDLCDFGSADIEKIIENGINTTDIGHQTYADITQELWATLITVIKDEDMAREMLDKLAGYRFVDEIPQFQRGRYIRWIKGIHLTNGGIITDIRFTDSGTHLLCKTGPRFCQVAIDSAIIFQKLSKDEHMALLLNELALKGGGIIIFYWFVFWFYCVFSCNHLFF